MNSEPQRSSFYTVSVASWRVELTLEAFDGCTSHKYYTLAPHSDLCPYCFYAHLNIATTQLQMDDKRRPKYGILPRNLNNKWRWWLADLVMWQAEPPRLVGGRIYLHS